MDRVHVPQGREDTPFVKAHRDELFPVLTEAQVARIAPFARERRFADGESLWEAGDRGISFFVVLEGEIAILSGADELVTVHGLHQFSGDVDLLSGRPVVVSARARGATRVLEVVNERFRALIQADAPLGETLLRAFLMRRSALMAAGLGRVVLIGSRFSAGTLALQEFLTRNAVPYANLDVERDADVQTTLDGFGVAVDDIPVVICRGARVLKKPTIEEVAGCLGLNAVNEGVVRDVVVVGAGPAGLASAVYAASEGLDALILEANAPGGQAGSTTRIENYLGFPSGISGQLLASRALVQAEKFGAELAVARTAASLACERRPYRVDLGDTSVQARTVIIATGVQYRKPDIPDLARFVGVGVYFGATPLEGALCAGEDVVVVGGGNSAGQAAVYLSGVGRHVTMLVRGVALSETMSRYLDPAHRGDSEHPAPHAHADHRARGERPPRARDVGRGGRGHDDGARAPRLPHDGRGPEYGVAEELRRPRREGLRENGTGPRQGRACRGAVAARAAADALRDEPPGRLRGWRRARLECQARCRSGRRGLRLRPARAQGAGGVVPSGATP